jgi:RimJ/RimL family protein N-acetyltransferase
VIEQGRTTHALAQLAAITDPDNTSSIRLLERLGFHAVRPMRLSPDSTEVMLFERSL